jgi:hypothetical protein
MVSDQEALPKSQKKCLTLSSATPRIISVDEDYTHVFPFIKN